ncbi:amino acid adenylation domain-containing protein [Pendulispora rubella]|uniref:Amino acid adenylation domain-containing protein n=1 Tax=Pendulispora rubella TaxID=2741070 RepID=A0ABZ2LGN5_9BACT
MKSISIQDKRAALRKLLEGRKRTPKTAPLSSAQQRIWFWEQFQPGSSVYNLPCTVGIEGVLNTNALHASLRALVERHEVLRTAIVSERQIILPDADLALPIVDLTHLDEAARAAEVRRLSDEETSRPFDLTEGRPLRVKLLRTGPKDHVLLFTMHHIASDGWSMSIFVRELAELYRAHTTGSVAALGELPIQYADYAVWQRDWLAGDAARMHLDYWREHLANAPAQLDLPTDRPRPHTRSMRSARHSAVVGANLTHDVRALSKCAGATLYMTLLAAFDVLLYRYSHQDDIVVGTPIANRTRSEIEGLIGFFVNTLALRTHLGGNPTFLNVLDRVRDVALQGYAHQDIPFEQVVEAVRASRETGTTPVFQVMFALQNAPASTLELPGVTLTVTDSNTHTGLFDLTLTVTELQPGGGLAVDWDYSPDVFDEATIARMAAHYETLLGAVVRDPLATIEGISLLSAAEQSQIVEGWNDTRTDLPGVEALHEIFERQAWETPEAVAATYEGLELRYAELDARANRLARRLRRAGVQPDACVGVCLENGLELPVAYLAILKAGGAIAPLDPSAPARRLAAHGELALVLATEETAGKLQATPWPVLSLDAEAASIADESDEPLPAIAAPEHVAYVIHTSGSTGTPKGILVTHRAICNRILWGQMEHPLTTADRVLQVSSIGFDASMWEFFATFAGGANFVLVPSDRQKDVAHLVSAIESERITSMTVVPSLLQVMLDEARGAKLPSLRLVFCGGEALSPALRDAFGACSEAKLVNVYGPSEAAIDTTYQDYDSGESSATISIGRPIGNVKVHVLDRAQAPVPVGVVGEMYIGGAGLARGYLGRPDHTAERFLPDPFSEGPGGRLYRTGDLARYTADGRISFVGRVDQQIKLRGIRIELGEIETALRLHPAVREAVVLVRSERLVAYLLAEGELDAAGLRAFLRETLPEAMVPPAFVFLDALPLTSSGKLDVRALPAPDFSGQATGRGGAPRNPTEELLAGIWGDVLGSSAVGIRDDFFELGGHSLLAVQIAARAREVFGKEVPIRWLFEAPTVEGLAARIARVDAAAQAAPVVPVPRDRRLPLSHEQESLWVTEQLSPGQATYNMPCAIRMQGALDLPALERALFELCARHESLRTTFAIVDGEPSQVIAPPSAVALPVVTLSSLPDTDREAAVRARFDEDARTGFDLAAGPLFRARLLRLSETDHVLLTSMHHIIADGWSMQPFVRELGALYDAFAQGKAPSLPAITTQYADYAAWQRERLRGSTLQKLVESAVALLSGAPAALDLPTDHPRPAVQTFTGATHTVAMPRPLLEGLRTLARRHGATLFMTLLAGFDALLHRYTHQGDIVVGTPVANRGRTEIENIIGHFVNTLVIRTRLDDDPTFGILLGRVKESALVAYAHQDVPFPLLLEKLQPPRDPSRSPVFQVMCELQNMPASDLALTGLSLTTVEGETKTAKFDLLLVFRETADDVTAVFEYNTDLFEAATIARMATHLETLLASAVDAPEERVSRLELLPAGERANLLAERNRTDTDWDTSVCFHHVFEEHVRAKPEAVAIVCHGTSATYAEVNARANRLAHVLRARLGHREVILGVLLDRSIEFLVTMIAVFKAGYAYVPLDPALPRARLESMVLLARCPIVVTEAAHAPLAGEIAGDRAQVLDVAEALSMPVSSTNPGFPIDPSSLAYVIFTSGSTGVPKGAMIEHRGMLNHLRAKVADLGFTAADCLAQTATQSFDVSVWQFLTALMVGGRVSVFRDESAWEPSRLMAQLARDQVTVFETVPTHTVLIVDELESAPKRYDLSRLRWLVVNGEPLLPDLCARWFARYPNVPMINAYGPTECSDDIAHYKMTAAPSGPWKYVPISGTLPNLRVYVLDAEMQPVPVGVAGELCIGGTGVGRGYLHAPERTATSFVPDPFGDTPGGRLYRTGDTVRYRHDGNIEFVGRVDHQVKIRGFRIEMGEIETALAAHAAVREGIVVARNDAGTEARLVAYVVPREPTTGAELAGFLGERLAAYMVPSAFVLLESLPLLPNGKVDRKALPAPRDADSVLQGDFVAPETETEAAVAGIWAELLDVARVGRTDDFFQLGGHSLIAIRTIARIRSAFGIELNVRTLFERATVAGVAAVIDERRAHAQVARAEPLLDLEGILRDAAATTAHPPPHYQLAPYQLPEWYMHELEPTNPFYNVTISDVVLHGAVDVPVFVRAWQTLIERHDVFRTRFLNRAGVPVQVVDPAYPLDVADVYIDRRHLAPDEVERETRTLVADVGSAPFDFERGPIFRVKLVEFPDQRFHLLFAIHHIVWDETSTMNFARELAEIYNAHRAGRAPRLPEISLSYAAYAHSIQRAVETGRFERQRRFWVSKLSPPPPALDLPIDYPRPALQTFRGSTVSQWLPGELAREVEAFVRREGLTLNIFFLAVLQLHLHRISGQSDFAVGTPIANRDDERLDAMLGLFATAMPMRCAIKPGMTFSDLLRAARDGAIEAYDHHHYPSILAIQEVNPEHDLSRNRLFSVMFGVQNNKTRLLHDLRFDGLNLEFLQKAQVAEFETAKFDLTVVVDQLASDIVAHWNFNSDLFKPATAERMLRQFLSLAEQAAHAPSQPIDAFELVSPEEARALAAFNATDVPWNRTITIHGLFEAQAARTPDASAVVEGARTWSYGELDRAVNRLARHLVALGVRPESRVGVLLEPSADMVVALLAILRAGGAYVPIMPGEPEERRDRIVAASGMRVLVTTGALAESGIACESIVRLDVDDIGALGDVAHAKVLPQNLAYVIFTSGTTGVPKGIEIGHGGVVNLLQATQRLHPLEAGDRVLFLTPYNFDASVLDVFWPLSVGAAVVVPPASASKHAVRLAETMAEHKVSAFQCVPLMLQSFIEAAEAGELPDIPSLWLVICGGAALSRSLRDRFARRFEARLSNHYGPTEVSVDAAEFDGRGEVDGDVVPIGRPLANVRMYVLDAAFRQLPIGVVGEIYVSSPGLARGYLGESARTAAAFLPDPFSRVPGTRMYRTGDLGRYRDDGNVEFIGRVDKQTKVRGNRVELEEIDVQLAAHPAVGRSVVQKLQRADAADALVAHLELRESALSIGPSHPGLRLFTLAQRPELRKAAEALHVEAWPAFFAGDCTLRNYWTRLADEFPECQFVLTDANDAVVAVGNAIPLAWDGTTENLPQGWDAGLERAFVDAERGIVPNTYFILTGVASRETTGRGLAAAILRAHKNLGHALGFERVVVAVRPNGKITEPEIDFGVWALRRRDDGQLEDPWLRTHERIGGNILRVEYRSQQVHAKIADWEKWSGRTFDRSGDYLLPDTLQAVRIDLESGFGKYDDPCVWVSHPFREDEVYTYAHVDGRALRTFMKRAVPDYMIPDHFRIVGTMPLTSSGKVDEGALSRVLLETWNKRTVPAQTRTQKRLADIWSQVLGVPSLGITDDFFELGGHSLRAVEMLAKVSSAFGVDIGLRDFFLARTVRDLEKHILARVPEEAPSVKPSSPYVDGMGEEAVGISTGHHGEILQGVTERDGRLHRVLVTLPCPLMKSEASFVPDRSGAVAVEPPWKIKAQRAAELALAWAQRENWGGRLELRSNIPIGCGLGSSTSDVLAAIRAVATATRKVIAPEIIAKLAVQAETASDSLMFPDRAVLFAHREGRVVEDLGGPLPPLEVLGINTDTAGIDTIELTRARYDSTEIEGFRVAIGLLRRAVRDGDPRLLARVATADARVSQRYLPKPHFKKLEELAESVGALGLQVAHSGTVVGLLFDPQESRNGERIARAKNAVTKLGFGTTWHFRTFE